MREIVLVAHNLRSTHNVGSLFRTADAMGVIKLYLTGYTPYPGTVNDKRLPHEQSKINKAIHKTALGAETSLDWRQSADILPVLDELKQHGFVIVALEQTSKSLSLPEYKATEKVALLIGREVEGLEAEVLEAADVIVEIPMHGQKESLNVVQAAAMALYHFRFD